jgi:hypothetical protein
MLAACSDLDRPPLSAEEEEDSIEAAVTPTPPPPERRIGGAMEPIEPETTTSAVMGGADPAGGALRYRDKADQVTRSMQEQTEASESYMDR